MAMKLTVVRHGQTLENAQDVVMGQHGGTLSEEGIKQVEESAVKLRDYKFDQAWSSDLKRCMDTARLILKYHSGLALNITPALREVNYGEFQGRPAVEIRDYFDKEGGFNQQLKVPGGESHAEMGDRVIKFVNGLLSDFPEQSILVISHSGPIEALRAAVEQTPFTSDALNAGIKTFEINSRIEPFA